MCTVHNSPLYPEIRSQLFCSSSALSCAYWHNRLKSLMGNKYSSNKFLLQSFTELLVQLQQSTGIEPKILLSRTKEQLLEPPRYVNNSAQVLLQLMYNYYLTSLICRLVADFVAAVDGASADSAWVKHYNFVDFSRFGSAWSPTYFNVVRDPIERVCEFIT